MFSLKGPRYAINRRVLAEAGDSIKRFLDSGVTELGDKLGPLLWQFAPNKKFDEADFGGFLELLPRNLRRPRAAPRRRSAPRQLQDAGVHRACCGNSTSPVVYAEHDAYTEIADITGDFVYARLQKGDEKLIPTAYPPKALDAWAERAGPGRQGGEPADLPRVDAKPPKKAPRDVFVYFIHEGKMRAPAAAMALIERLKDRNAENENDHERKGARHPPTPIRSVAVRQTDTPPRIMKQSLSAL